MFDHECSSLATIVRTTESRGRDRARIKLRWQMRMRIFTTEFTENTETQSERISAAGNILAKRIEESLPQRRKEREGLRSKHQGR
jgi:hypothetical protein